MDVSFNKNTTRNIMIQLKLYTVISDNREGTLFS